MIKHDWNKHNSQRQIELVLNRTAVKRYAHSGPRHVIDCQCLFWIDAHSHETDHKIHWPSNTHLKQKCDKNDNTRQICVVAWKKTWQLWLYIKRTAILPLLFLQYTYFFLYTHVIQVTIVVWFSQNVQQSSVLPFPMWRIHQCHEQLSSSVE